MQHFFQSEHENKGKVDSALPQGYALGGCLVGLVEGTIFAPGASAYRLSDHKEPPLLLEEK